MNVSTGNTTHQLPTTSTGRGVSSLLVWKFYTTHVPASSSYNRREDMKRLAVELEWVHPLWTSFYIFSSNFQGIKRVVQGIKYPVNNLLGRELNLVAKNKILNFLFESTTKTFPGLKTIINALLHSFRQLAEVMTLTIFCLMVFALFALQVSVAASVDHSSRPIKFPPP